MNEPIHILIVEDLEADFDLAGREIRKVIPDCVFQCVETRNDFIRALEDFRPDLILSDYHLPDFDGMKALEITLERASLTPLIIWTGSLSEDIAVECMKAGANNYILKENLQRLGPAVLHALEERRLSIKHRQAEEALAKSERRFRALIENGLDNISLLAADGSLLWESPAVYRTLDYAPDEFRGQDIFKLMHPDDLDWTRELYAKLVQEPGRRQRGVFRLRHSNGTWRWVEAIVTNMLEEPSVNAIVVNYRDITGRRQSEEALRESENKAKALLNALPDLMFRLDREGTFLDYKAEASDLYVRSGESLIGKNNRDIAPAEFADLIEEFTRRTLESGQMQMFEYQLPIAERGLRHYEARMVTSGKDEVTAIVRDITERKQAEE
ncbi:MAG TPA: PAS domain S-box protein, partial [Anaerolineales bacterium]|nr:PAS domain S-box protein [Anaerolineales bacterium]